MTKKAEATKTSKWLVPALVVLLIVAAVTSAITYSQSNNTRIAGKTENRACSWLDQSVVAGIYGTTATNHTEASTALTQQSSSNSKPIAQQQCESLLNQPNASGEDDVTVQVWFFDSAERAADYARKEIEPRRYWGNDNNKPGDTNEINKYVVVGDGGRSKAQYITFYTVVNDVALEVTVPCSDNSINNNDLGECITATDKIGAAIREKASNDPNPNPFN